MFVSFLRRMLVQFVVGRFGVLRDVHRFAFAKHAKKIALRTREGVFTYADLRDRVQRLIAAFEAEDLVKGDVVFSLLNDGLDQVALRFATGDAGLVLAAFNPAHPADQFLSAHATCPAKLFMYHADIGQTVSDRFMSDAHDVVQWKADCPEFEAKLEAVTPHYSSVDIAPEDTAALGYTSGTTGAPKAMLSSHGTPITSLKMLIENIRDLSGGPNIAVLGIPLVGAGSGLLLPAIMAGGELIIPPSYKAAVLAKTIETYKATRTFVTPSLLVDLLDEAAAGDFDASSLTSIIYGTAPTSAAKIREAVTVFGPILSQGYGMAEVLPPVSMLHPEDHLIAGRPAPRCVLGSVGRVVKGVDVRIVNEAGEDMPVGEIGEVLIKSPTTFGGYLNNPAANAETFLHGYYRTRDFGFFSTGGLLNVLDRAPDRIMRDGVAIYPRQTEEEAHEHTAIKEALMVQDESGNAVLCISLRKGKSALNIEDELRAFIAPHLSASQMPDVIQVFDDLPRSYLGKVLRRDVREALKQAKAA